MKACESIMVAVMMLVAAAAQAQLGNYRQVLTTEGYSTNVLHSNNGTITNTYRANGPELSLHLNSNRIGSGPGGIRVVIDKSVDGHTWSLMESNFVSITGATNAVWVTNYTVGAQPMFRVWVGTTVGESLALTNLTLKAASR